MITEDPSSRDGSGERSGGHRGARADRVAGRRPARTVRPGLTGRPQPRSAAPAEGYLEDEFDVDYQPGQRRGAHRTATPLLLQRLPWLVAALLAVGAVVAAVLLLTDVGGTTGSITGPTGTDPAATDPAATDPAATDPAATDPATSDPAATSAPDTSAPATTSEPPPADRSLELVVLNGTTTSGLAAAMGEELTEQGWTVGTVGNAPRPARTTVVLYSADEHRATAEAVADAMGVEARFDGTADGPVVVVLGTDRA